MNKKTYIIFYAIATCVTYNFSIIPEVHYCLNYTENKTACKEQKIKVPYILSLADKRKKHNKTLIFYEHKNSPPFLSVIVCLITHFSIITEIHFP